MATKNETSPPAPADKAVDDKTTDAKAADNGGADKAATDKKVNVEAEEKTAKTAENGVILTDEVKKYIADTIDLAVAKLADSAALDSAVARALGNDEFKTWLASVIAQQVPGDAGAANPAPDAEATAKAAKEAAKADKQAAAAREKQEEAERQRRDTAMAKAKQAFETFVDDGELKAQAVMTSEDFELIDGFFLLVSDGETFHPDIHISLDKDVLALTGDLVTVGKVVTLSADELRFSARQYFLVGEGKAARALSVGDLPFGSGREAQLPAGSLVFRLGAPPAPAA